MSGFPSRLARAGYSAAMGVNFEADPDNVFFRCVEDSSEAIMISDLKGRLVYVNPAWSRIYGYAREEAVGGTPRLLHSGHQSEDFYRGMWSKIRDPEFGTFKGELINRAKDGSLVPVLLTIIPFKDATGELRGYMGVAVDLTYRKELEAKVVHQDRLASIGILSSGLAHEIGTPLGVIRGRAEFLAMRASHDPVMIKGLEVIITQIDRISRLIRSLLGVSRSVPTNVRIEPVSPLAVSEEILTLVGQNLHQIGCDIRVEIDPDLRAMADSSRLQQVVLNLLMNSIHAIRAAIEQGRIEGHFVEISAERRHGKICFAVRDSGCGIPAENLKKLFKPFFTTKQVGEGTGLGLAIVAGLVSEMKGEIWAESTPGQGATFSMLLDAAN